MKLYDGTNTVSLCNVGASNSHNAMSNPYASQLTQVNFSIDHKNKKILVTDNGLFLRATNGGTPTYTRTIAADDTSFSALNLSLTNLIITHTHYSGSGSSGYHGIGGTTYATLSVIGLSSAGWI
jgi:hypothetical protein